VTTSPITPTEVGCLVLDPGVRALLSPEVVAEHVVLPLELEGEELTVAADPAASASAERSLRLRLGLRKVHLRPATREVFKLLLELHFNPFWESRGLDLPILPREPVTSVPTEDPSPADAPSGGNGTSDYPVVLLVEPVEARRGPISALLGDAGVEARFATTRDEVERELRLATPSVIGIRRGGGLDAEDLLPLVRERSSRTEVRVVPEPGLALMGSAAGDERLPTFLFDLARFFVGLIANAGGGRLDRTEAMVRLAESAARRLELPASETEATRLAAVLGELDDHLARLRGAEAIEGASALGMLLDPARTPYPVAEALDHQEERFDGTGPRGLAGDRIPAPARVLATIRALLDLRDTEAKGTEIESRLREQAGTRLDPRTVEAVLRADRAGRLVDRLDEEETRDRILLVDPDPALASLLEMRLGNAGFAVEVHRDGATALEAALASPPVLTISEVSVPMLDGFSLLLRLRREEATADMPFVFLSERAERGATVRGLELGADDFLAKPVDLDFLAAKVKSLVRKARPRVAETAPATGVAGDLTEMEVVDLLQVLSASGRTAVVRLAGRDGFAGEISLDSGRVVDARCGGEEGVDAFQILISRSEGRFTVERSSPASRTIDAPLESLLLEACRLRDEAGRG